MQSEVATDHLSFLFFNGVKSSASALCGADRYVRLLLTTTTPLPCPCIALIIICREPSQTLTRPRQVSPSSKVSLFFKQEQKAHNQETT